MDVCLEVGDKVSTGGSPLQNSGSRMSRNCLILSCLQYRFSVRRLDPQYRISPSDSSVDRPGCRRGSMQLHSHGRALIRVARNGMKSNIKVCTFPDNRQTLDQDQDKVKAVGAYQRDLRNSSDPRCALRPDHCQRHQCYPAPHPATIRNITIYGSKSRQDRQTWIVPFPCSIHASVSLQPNGATLIFFPPPLPAVAGTSGGARNFATIPRHHHPRTNLQAQHRGHSPDPGCPPPCRTTALPPQQPLATTKEQHTSGK